MANTRGRFAPSLSSPTTATSRRRTARFTTPRTRAARTTRSLAPRAREDSQPATTRRSPLSRSTPSRAATRSVYRRNTSRFAATGATTPTARLASRRSTSTRGITNQRRCDNVQSSKQCVRMSRQSIVISTHSTDENRSKFVFAPTDSKNTCTGSCMCTSMRSVTRSRC